ncbi:FAD-dependent oxidoreductase [Zhihengliuella alba]|uniref:FAD-dependent oxidoreductase n=1 Tax=Zhihengliuella alba TaxID=547018 RepID=A0ABP7DUU4_9MICC
MRHDLQHSDLPVVVIGAGPVGLAAAAHLLERGVTPLVLEAGPSVGAAVAQWGHIQTFSTWAYNTDAAAVRLLEAAGWAAPNPKRLPTGRELVKDYLEPLAATPAIAAHVRTGHRVVAVTRAGLDKTRARDRAEAPFLVRTEAHGADGADGVEQDLEARAVIDASGTWGLPNPVGPGGLEAVGERATRAAGVVTSALPDVLGADRARFAGRTVLVIGAGHSAANTVLSLGRLAAEAEGTRVIWGLRGDDPSAVYGGEERDGLPARGALGARLRTMVAAGRIEVRTGFRVLGTRTTAEDRLTVRADERGEDTELEVDLLVPATGFRPDLGMLRELRLDLDPAFEAPRELAPLIDPEFHSCGTVPPHGAELLAHPEEGFFIVGMKSYGRAPTFLMATGYEQVRSIAAHLAGDTEAAARLELDLPETGVCSTDAGSCCDAPAEPQLLGIPTGLAHGRNGLATERA